MHYAFLYESMISSRSLLIVTVVFPPSAWEIPFESLRPYYILYAGIQKQNLRCYF